MRGRSSPRTNHEQPQSEPIAMSRIPSSRPCFVGHELEYIEEAVRGGHISGNGPFSRRCESFLEKELGAAKVLLTTSCTHALEMSALLLGIGPGDEVIVPSFTFVSTINAFTLYGAKPVFCDIRPDTLNMDEALLPKLITERTRAIVPVHYAGVSCDMVSIAKTAEAAGVTIIEDNAHGLFGKQDGRLLGSTGAFSTLSFHETKNFSCGEGGALVINDSKWIEPAEIAREKGTNRVAFNRGEVDKYTWVERGSSWLPSDLLAAFLMAQLECKKRILEVRKRLFMTYRERVADWAAANEVRLPLIPAGCESAWHMFQLMLPSPEVRTRFLAHLNERDVAGVFHYIPLHTSPMGARFGAKPGDCPVTEHVAATIARLPFYDDLSEEEVDRVCDAVLSFSA